MHEALYELPGSTVPQGTVVQVAQSGYTLHDRTLRPARVGLAAAVEARRGARPPRRRAAEDDVVRFEPPGPASTRRTERDRQDAAADAAGRIRSRQGRTGSEWLGQVPPARASAGAARRFPTSSAVAHGAGGRKLAMASSARASAAQAIVAAGQQQQVDLPASAAGRRTTMLAPVVGAADGQRAAVGVDRLLGVAGAVVEPQCEVQQRQFQAEEGQHQQAPASRKAVATVASARANRVTITRMPRRPALRWGRMTAL
ncbi:MAG: nucleotide exchange factor GrpE [Rhodospirillales bacterium]